MIQCYGLSEWTYHAAYSTSIHMTITIARCTRVGEHTEKQTLEKCANLDVSNHTQ